MFLIKNVKYVMIFISLNFFLAIFINAQEENNIGNNNTIKSQNLNIKKLNDLNFRYPNIKKFPFLKILKVIPNNNSLFRFSLCITNSLCEFFFSL